MSTFKQHAKTFGRGFIEGFSSIFGVTMDEPELPKKGFYQDRKGLQQDWKNVGKDMEKAIYDFEEEYKVKEK